MCSGSEAGYLRLIDIVYHYLRLIDVVYHVFKAHRRCVSLNSRLESNQEEEEGPGSRFQGA